ncbi:MAG: hypothetical protein V2A58_03905 [Planctomycetota bacterium]
MKKGLLIAVSIALSMPAAWGEVQRFDFGDGALRERDDRRCGLFAGSS